jgi:uncharacterized protein YjbI with pentapeptide repeats
MVKKKLPTGPIRIESPKAYQSKQDFDLPENEKQDSSKDSFLSESNLENDLPDSDISEPQVNDSDNNFSLEKQNSDSSLQDSSLQDSSLQDSSLQDSSLQDSSLQDSSLQDSSLQDSSLQDSSVTEYKKVAMRLSTEATKKLTQLRNETGLPYEILVDVMIRHWDNLSQRTQSAYLKEAKKVRQMRLIAGQKKAMETMQQRLLDE